MENKTLKTGEKVRVRGFNMVGQIYPAAIGTVLRIEKYNVTGANEVFDKLTVVDAETDNELFVTVELENGEHRFDRLGNVEIV